MNADQQTGVSSFVLRGEAGIGKTRLCLEFADIAIASGFEFHRALVLDFGAALGQRRHQGP